MARAALPCGSSALPSPGPDLSPTPGDRAGACRRSHRILSAGGGIPTVLTGRDRSTPDLAMSWKPAPASALGGRTYVVSDHGCRSRQWGTRQDEAVGLWRGAQ